MTLLFSGVNVCPCCNLPLDDNPHGAFLHRFVCSALRLPRLLLRIQVLLLPADECAQLCAFNNSTELWIGGIIHGCAHRICWTCGTQEDRSVYLCGPEGSSCVVNLKDEDFAET